MQMNIQEMATAVAQELPLIVCVFNNGRLGMVRQMQKLFYEERYAATCLRARKSCGKHCGVANCNCPPYLPDFIKLAESYSAYGIRVENEDQIRPAFLEAMEHKNAPTIIEFLIDSEELVMPTIQGGKALSDMILGN